MHPFPSPIFTLPWIFLVSVLRYITSVSQWFNGTQILIHVFKKFLYNGVITQTMSHHVLSTTASPGALDIGR